VGFGYFKQIRNQRTGPDPAKSGYFKRQQKIKEPPVTHQRTAGPFPVLPLEFFKKKKKFPPGQCRGGVGNVTIFICLLCWFLEPGFHGNGGTAGDISGLKTGKEPLLPESLTLSPEKK